MKFWFCETCGKRLTDMEMEAGQARNKKLAGVYCLQCAAGIMTVETMPLSEAQARKILNKHDESASPLSKGELPQRSSASIAQTSRQLKANGVQKKSALGAKEIKSRTGITMVAIVCLLSGSLMLTGLLIAFPARTQKPEKRETISPRLDAPSAHANSKPAEHAEMEPDKPVAYAVAHNTATQEVSALHVTPLPVQEPAVAKPTAHLEENEVMHEPQSPTAKEVAQQPAVTVQAPQVPVVQNAPTRPPLPGGRKVIETHFVDRLPVDWKIEGDALNRIADGNWLVNVKGSRIVSASLTTTKSFPLDRRYRLTLHCGSKGSIAEEEIQVGVFNADSKIISGNYRSEGISARIGDKLRFERRNVGKPWDQIPLFKAIDLPKADEHKIEFEISSTGVSLTVDGINQFSGPHQGLAEVKEVKFLLLGQNNRNFKGNEIWFRDVCLEELTNR